MYTKIANVLVCASLIGGLEDQFQLLGRLESEGGQEVEVLRVEVCTLMREEGDLVVGDSYVLKLWAS